MRIIDPKVLPKKLMTEIDRCRVLLDELESKNPVPYTAVMLRALLADAESATKDNFYIDQLSIFNELQSY